MFLVAQDQKLSQSLRCNQKVYSSVHPPPQWSFCLWWVLFFATLTKSKSLLFLQQMVPVYLALPNLKALPALINSNAFTPTASPFVQKVLQPHRGLTLCFHIHVSGNKDSLKNSILPTCPTDGSPLIVRTMGHHKVAQFARSPYHDLGNQSS